MFKSLKWLLGAGGAAALVIVAVVDMSRSAPSHHPHPRPDVTATGVLPDFILGATPDARPAYALARGYPAVLDGMRCFCNCKASFGHRSLLSCFEDQHGANCQICQDEARLGVQVVQGGGSLDDARRAVDREYGSGG